jgi:hypothetical protein
MKKKVIIALLLIVIVAAGYIGFIKYEQFKLVKSITPHVKNASLRLENALRYETENNTKITYKELFEKLESDVSEIDNRILAIQTIATPNDKKVIDPVLEYLKSSQEFLRALLSMYRKQLAYGSIRDWTEQSLDDLKNAGSSYEREYASKAFDNAIKEAEKSLKEYGDSQTDILSAAKNMKEMRSKAAVTIPIDALADPNIFESIIKKNSHPKSDSNNEKNQ